MKKLLVTFLILASFFFASYSEATIYGEQTNSSNTSSTTGGYPQRKTSTLGTPSTTQTVGDAWLIVDVSACTSPCDFYTSTGGDNGWRLNTTSTAYQEWLWADGLGHYSGWTFNSQTGKVGLKFTGVKWNASTSYTLSWGTFDSPGVATLKSNANNDKLFFQMNDQYAFETVSAATSRRRVITSQ